MLQKAVPFLEVYNREQIVEAGFKYKEEILKLKSEITNNGKTVGTLQGDRHIEEAESDPNMFLKELEKLDDHKDETEEEMKNGTYGANKLNSIFSKIQKQQ